MIVLAATIAWFCYDRTPPGYPPMSIFDRDAGPTHLHTRTSAVSARGLAKLVVFLSVECVASRCAWTTYRGLFEK